MKTILTLSTLLILSGCFRIENSKKDRLYLKQFKDGDRQISWFYKSLITSDTPDFVLIEQGEKKIDSVCSAHNLADVELSGDTIKLFFYGSPLVYSRRPEIPPKVGNYTITVDTTRISEGPAVRKTFKIP